jgi:DNA replication protein DnaC
VDAKVRKRIRTFLACSDPRWPLVLWGAVGCGKSCAALCLADRVNGAIYQTLRELADVILEARAGKLWRDAGAGEGMIRVSEWSVWRQLDRAPLVVLDELGTRKAGDLEYEILKRVLDKREGRPLVCVSNHAPAELAKLFDARVADRLEGGTVIEYPGGSRRR